MTTIRAFHSFFIYRVSKDGSGRRQPGPACGVKTHESGTSLLVALFPVKKSQNSQYSQKFLHINTPKHDTRSAQPVMLLLQWPQPANSAEVEVICRFGACLVSSMLPEDNRAWSQQRSLLRCLTLPLLPR